MEGVKCYCNLIAEFKTSHTDGNFNRIFYRCPKKSKAEQCKFWSWAEDLPPTQLSQHMDTTSESPATSQASSSTPVKMKRSASSMQESSDFSQASPSQKRVKLMETALADGGSSGHSGPSITSPNANVNNAGNKSALQPSVSVGLNANREAAFPQIQTRSATRLATYSLSPALLISVNNLAPAPQRKDESMAYPSGSGEMTPELIGNLVTDYARKLDRKRIATEKSLDARDKRNRNLEDQNQNLRDQNRILEDEKQDLKDEVKRLKDRQKELELIIAGYEYTVNVK